MNEFKMNSKGSALIIVLMIVMTISISAFMVLQRSTDITRVQAQKSAAQTADSVAQLISTVLSSRTVCLGGFDGPNPAEAGMQFYDTAGNLSNFNYALASSASGQNISAPGIYPSGPGVNNAPLRFTAGLNIPNSSLRLNRIYLSNASPDSSMLNLYNVRVMADFGSTQSNTNSLVSRAIADLKIQTNGAAMIDCMPNAVTNTNQILCEGMGCVYTISANGQGNCTCPLEPVTCANGTYVTSVVGNVAQCSTATVSRSCASQTNSFLVALDQAGNPVCGSVVTCPAGSSRAGAGGAASPVDCRCANAGETWNGSNCSVPAAVVAGNCGGANGGTFADATAANAAGLCASGSASPASLSGAGPWSWSCNGSGGGTNMSCSAFVAVATPTPTPTPTPAGGTWQMAWIPVSPVLACTLPLVSGSMVGACNFFVGTACPTYGEYCGCGSPGPIPATYVPAHMQCK